MNIRGLKVDAPAIAKGIYAMICDRDEEAIVAVGMIPLWVHDTLQKLTREKIIALYAVQMECSVADVTPYVDEKKLAQIVQETIHEVVVAIYSEASARGKMIC